jgi:hypothetical protein
MPGEPTILRSYSDLAAHLGGERVPHTVEPASKSIRIPTRQKGIDGVQVIRWQDGDGALQFIQSMLRDIPADRMGALEAAIARLNHALAWIGLDLNHDHRLLAFRLVLPLFPRGAIDAREVQAAFRAAVKIAADLTPVVARVVSGELAPEQVVDEVRRSVRAAGPTAEAGVFQID